MNLAKEHGSNDDGSQEGITVAIRMRPLNNAEENNKRIWKVLQKYSSITQTTRDGKPLPERTTGRTFFTFDKTFGENTNNKQVYESVAQGIVNSVVDGLNGTIFAYGQTSSGKTYTMQGAGNIEQGMGGEGGVVHMAANDIFSQIAQKQERNFLVRVSFLEIYNEEVRDLLGDVNQTLKIREDPRHGVFVQSQEEIVTNFDGLLRILGRGDKSRTFAATGMNERSSRSHTILRITIESREKEFETEEEEEDDDMMDIGVGNSCGDGSVRISTLNLVDLAGSESVRHTGATGERQKEGGLINQSLLTLSRVIVALGAPNQMHVNFRDSKLTRILQPSLSGNARMAIICCATPSELYLEETRSTLQFASRAKLVKTNAQVNEVLDERSMIRRLQKELAEAKRNQSGVEQGQVRDLEAQVATAGTQAMEAKKKLDRLKASILNTGYIIDQVPGLSSENHIKKTKKRRKSDGHLLLSLLSPEKMNKADVKSPKTAPRRHKNNVLQYQRLDIEQELKLVQEALATRNSFVRDLNLKLSQYSEQIKGKNCDLENLRAHNTTLIEESKISKDSIMDLEETVVSLKQTLDSSLKENEQALAEKDSEVIEFFEKLQQALRQNEAFENNSKENVARLAEVEGEKVILEERISSVEDKLERERESHERQSNDLITSIQSLQTQNDEMGKALERETQSKVYLQDKFSKTEQENKSLVKSLESRLVEMEQQLEIQETVKKQLEEKLSNTQQQTEFSEKTLQSQLSGMVQRLQEEESMRKDLEVKLSDMESLEKTLRSQLVEMEKRLQEEVTTKKQWEEALSDVRQENESAEKNLQSQLAEMEQRLQEEAGMKKQVEDTLSKTQQETESLEKMFQSQLSEMEQQVKEETAMKKQLEEKLETIIKDSKLSLTLVSTEKKQLEDQVQNYQKNMEDLNEKVESLEERQQIMLEEKDSAQALLRAREEANLDLKQQIASTEEQVSIIKAENKELSVANDIATNELEAMKETMENTKSELSKLKEELEKSRKETQSIEKENEAKGSVIGPLKEQIESATAEVHELRDVLSSVKSELENQEAVCAQLSQEKKILESAMGGIEGEMIDKDVTLEQLRKDKEQAAEDHATEAAGYKKEISDLHETLSDTKSKLEHQESEILKVSKDWEALEAHMKEMEDINTAKIATLEELHADKELANGDLEERLKQSSEENQKLQDDLIVTKSKLEQQESEFAQLSEEKAALETHLEEMEDITTAKIATLEELHAEKETSSQQMDEKLKQSSEENQKLQDDLIVTKSKLEQQESEFAQLLEEKAALETHLEEMEDITTAKIATLEELQAARESLSQKMEEELKKAEDLQNILTVAESEVKMLSLEKESLEIRIQSMEDIHASKESVIEELRVSAQEKDECTSKLKEKIEMYRTKIETLEKNFASAEGGEARKDSIIKQLRVEREELQMKLDTKISEAEKLENKATDFECLIGRLSADVEIHNNEIETLLLNLMQITGEKEELESSHVELKYSCESLTTENEAMHDRFSALECKNAEVEEELECLMIEYKKLTERNSALEESEQFLKKAQTKIQKTVAEYEEEVTDLSEQIGTVFNEVLSFEDRNNELQLTIDNLQRKLQEKNTAFLQIQKDIETMAGSRDEMLRNLQNCRAERDEAKNEVKNIINSRDSMIQSLRDREAERDEATSELERLYDEIRDLNSNKTASKAKESELFEEVSELKVQNLELKRLLASVNETEEKLRNALKIAEKENMTKTQELEDAQHRISRIEQELSKSQIVDVELSRVEQSKADLLVSLEIIQREKENIEQSLQEETNARNELQQQMREEQRALIQEGENMMAALRKQLEECETKLNQSESEAYAARKQVEEITDERNRLEEKYLETSTQLSSSDSSKQRQEEEMATLRSKLNDSKSESYALKEAAIDMKEKMRRATRDSEKAIRENEIANSELSTTRRKLVSLENLNEANHTENLKLRKKLKDLEVNETLAKELQKELEKRESEVAIMSNEISCLKLEIRKETDSTLEAELGKTEKEMKMMKNELDEMNELMKQKEKRIKKLEAVRLTKDQLAQIKKMKTDNLQYEKKCSKLEKDLSRLQKHISTTGSEGNMSSHRSHYEQKCLHLEKEIDRLQNQLSTAGSETNLSLEVNELRFDKEALERKLRKFATHCQRLEDDKAGMADALRSCNINIETHGNNVTDAIVHLCDKLASIEEVHDKQLNNSFHEKEKSSLQQKIEKLSHSEEKLTEKLNQYQRDNAKLQEKLEKIATKPASGDSDEHRENIRYLEHENLQLMHDMKSVKRQLQAAREEIETLRMNGIGRSPNSKFGSLDTRASMKHPLSPTTTCSSSKENSDTMELANLAEACTKNILRLSARKTKKRNVLSDNTNGLKDEHREERLADKRRKVIGLADKEKVDRVATNNISTPGLGESSSHSTENTGECKQS